MAVKRDIKFAFRMQLKKPAFTAVTVLILALGVGANTAIFSLVSAVFLKSLPYREPDRLVLMMEGSKQGWYPVAYPNYVDWREMNRTFDEIACFRPGRYTLQGGVGPEKIDGKLVSANFFATLGTPPSLGRAFTAAEDSASGERVVIIDHSLWQRRFGGNPDVLGRSLSVDGESHTIVGVAPAGFRFWGESQLYFPIHPSAHKEPRYDHDALNAIGRLKTGVTLEQAQADMKVVARQLEERYPKENAGEFVAMTSLEGWMTGYTRSLLLIFAGAVAFVLLIACVNVASLQLVRLNERDRELSVRAALGADRSSLIRQTLIESLLLALEGGTVGLLLASVGLSALTAFVPPEVAPLVQIDGWVLAFTFLLCCATSVLFGLAPALKSSRSNLAEFLKQGERTGAGASQHRLRDMLVVSEVALALILLIGAGLMIRSAFHLMNVDPGFRADQIVIMKVEPPDSRFLEPAKTENGMDFDIVARLAGEYSQLLIDRVRPLPGIQAAASVFPLVMQPGSASLGIAAEGAPRPADGNYPRAYRYSITSEYFKTMGIPVLKGRTFSPTDNWSASRVAIVSETMARQFWPGRDPIGRTFKIQNFEQFVFTVVGLVGDTRHESLQSRVPPQLYLSQLQWPGSFTLVIRTPLPADKIASMVREQVAVFDKEAPVSEVGTLKERMTTNLRHGQQVTLLLSAFAALALILAVVGIYGVMAQAVSERTREIGLRIAIGASPSVVLRMVLRRALLLSAAGVALGIVGAFALTRWLENWLHGVTPTDPLTFAVLSGLIILVGFVATFRPARRAASVDPITALRCE